MADGRTISRIILQDNITDYSHTKHAENGASLTNRPSSRTIIKLFEETARRDSSVGRAYD